MQENGLWDLSNKFPVSPATSVHLVYTLQIFYAAAVDTVTELGKMEKVDA